MHSLGRLLVAMGIGIALTGLLLLLFGGRLGWLGRLPGDIRTPHVFFPLTSCLLGSLVLTFLINLVLRILGR